MADFFHAFMLTERIEGGWVNDPVDPGGETYKGIARNIHPHWEGWTIIDGYDKSSVADLDMALDRDDDLQRMVEGFYKSEYWDYFRGDDICDQFLADELFDTAVNLGWPQAAKFLQRGLNALNRDGKLYPDLWVDEDGEPDGIVGPVTLRTLAAFLNHDDVHLLLKVMNVLQGMHYIRQMEQHTVKEKYARGWLARVEFIRP